MEGKKGFIYSKHISQKRFSLTNINRGEQVTRKMHATLVDVAYAREKLIPRLKLENPEFDFKISITAGHKGERNV